MDQDTMIPFIELLKKGKNTLFYMIWKFSALSNSSPEGGRTHPLVFPEQSVEVTRICKPELMDDLVHLHVRIAQPCLDQSQLVVGDILLKTLSRPALEILANIGGRNIKVGGDLLHLQLFGIINVLMDIAQQVRRRGRSSLFQRRRHQTDIPGRHGNDGIDDLLHYIMLVRLLIDMLPYQRLYQASDQRLVRPVVDDTARKMVVVEEYIFQLLYPLLVLGL